MSLSQSQPKSTSLDSLNTQQERFNSKLVPFSPCCALLRLVTLGASIQPWQPGPQTTMPMSLFYSSRASTLTYITGKQHSPCLYPRNRSRQDFSSVISPLDRYLVNPFHLKFSLTGLCYQLQHYKKGTSKCDKQASDTM